MEGHAHVYAFASLLASPGVVSAWLLSTDALLLTPQHSAFINRQSAILIST